MPGRDFPTELITYSFGGVMVMPPVASVIPYPLMSSILLSWKN